MSDHSFKLKEPHNIAEFNFETPLITLHDSQGETSSISTNLFHEQQHAVDLFSLYPSPLLNSTIHNYLLLKALLQIFYSDNKANKKEWKERIVRYERKLNRIRKNYYVTAEDEDLSFTNVKLDVLFEATAIEKQVYDYIRNLYFYSKGSKNSFSTQIEGAEYIRKLYNSNIQYKKAGALLLTFGQPANEKRKIRDIPYQNSIPLTVKSFRSPPNIESFLRGQDTADKVFPLKPPLGGLIKNHLLTVNHSLEKLAKKKKNQSLLDKILHQAKRNCENWVDWTDRLQKRLKDDLKVNGKNIYWDSILDYAINLPLENIKRANILEKLFIDSYFQSGKQETLGAYRGQLMIDNKLTSNRVPESFQKIFEEKRNAEGVENLIVNIPVISFRNGELMALFKYFTTDQGKARFQAGHWIEFFLVNGLAHNLPKLLDGNADFFNCPILERLESGQEIAKLCKQTHGLPIETSCDLVRNYQVEDQTCLFRQIVFDLVMVPIARKESESQS